MALRILTAFKAGGLYEEHHIARLKEQVLQYTGLELQTVYGEFPHWWCKMSVFRIKGPALYFDLDTTIISDITPLIEAAQRERFITLRDFNRDRVASGVMAWNGDVSHIYDEFSVDPEGFMNQYPGGDQDFIHDGGHCPVYWQDILPNHIQSYKCHIRRNTMHPECRVVAFHGKPRPWDIPELVKE